MMKKQPMNHFPKISVVTPSYNQAQFVEETLQSVLGQFYPNLEYIVMDGGSTDNSAAVIRNYEDQLAFWTSEKDGGQSDAINKGFAKSTGDILCWLNSDDLHLPGTLRYAAEQFKNRLDEPLLLFGNTMHMNEVNAKVQGSNVRGLSEHLNLQLSDYIIQPSSFWTRKAWETVGELRKDYHFGFDWEWFARAEKAGVQFEPTDRYLSVYRIHEAHKTGGGGDKRTQELAAIYREKHGDRIAEAFLSLHEREKEIVSLNLHYSRYSRLLKKHPVNFYIWKQLKTNLTFEEYSNLARMAGLWK
tara:strand:+ start:3568 stop:4470 length:903 start_codon:yes stop_codon:yes gene_type:complete